MAQNGQQPNRLAVVTGFGIAILWVAMALYCLVSAIQGFVDHRPDYGLAWSLVGVFLLAAGIAAGFGTWWHQYRRPVPGH